jgi:hypothetical protein
MDRQTIEREAKEFYKAYGGLSKDLLEAHGRHDLYEAIITGYTPDLEVAEANVYLLLFVGE